MRYVAALACALFAVLAFAATAGATITTTTVEYGPWTIPAGNGPLGEPAAPHPSATISA
jgi:hypothetical protein